VQVEAGGLRVKGGFSLMSGDFDLGGNPFNIGQLAVSSSDKHPNAPLITAKVSSSHHSGAAIEVISSANPKTNSLFLAKNGNNGESVMEIDGEGTVHSAGGADFRGSQGVTVRQIANLHGGLSLSQTTVEAGATITVASTASAFVTILDDNKKSRNDLVLPTTDTGAKLGQLLLIYNADEHQTRGALEIPSQSTVLLIFDGQRWNDVHALHAPVTVRTYFLFLCRVSSFCDCRSCRMSNR
jgi:hypothetical protein